MIRFLAPYLTPAGQVTAMMLAIMLLLAVGSTLFVWMAGFNWYSEQHSAAYWQDRLTTSRWALAAAVVFPVPVMAASVASIAVRPRKSWRTTLGVLIAETAVADVVISAQLGSGR